MNKNILPKLQANQTLWREHAYINGAWLPAVSNATFPVIDPGTGTIIAHVADCAEDETKLAIASADAAFSVWKAQLPKVRADLLMRWYALIQENAETLAQILSIEQGKPLAESRGEIAYGASFVEWFAQEGRRAYGRTIPPFRENTHITVTKEPIGVCAAITPWNFPHSMITRKVAPALAAGCTVILKPAAETPLSALALAALADKAGIPKGVFNVVTTSKASLVGGVLTSSPDIHKLSFTGSTAIGRTLMAQCAPTLKAVTMELGGNAPFIVFDDCDLEAAVNGALLSKFRNSGQTCVCTNRFYVQKTIHAQFVAKLVSSVKDLKCGYAFDETSTQGPLINQAGLDKVKTLLADAIQKGARTLCGGNQPDQGGLYYEPTVLDHCTHAMRMAEEEIFGPIAAIYTFENEAEAIAMANASEHGLAAYVYTKDLGTAARVSQALEFGMVGVNTGLISTEVAPFGGVKQSGFGREGAIEGLGAYLNEKYTLWDGLALTQL